MFLEHFKLSVQPFGVTPDPRFLYLGQTHREALASLLYGIQSGRGFTALIAAPGMGKTTLLFRLLGLMARNTKTAFLFRTLGAPEEFLRTLLADLEIEDEGVDLARMHAKLNSYLLKESRSGRQVVAVIDEAQNLDERLLEMTRMLSNFETPGKKLLHIVLSGQPQLAEKLSSERLTQLRQRISIVARLAPFTAAETREYIEQRLRVAGAAAEKPLFSDKAYALIADHSGGIPRNINNLCFNSMSLAWALQRPKVDALMVQEAINDLNLKVIASPKAPEDRQPSRPAGFTGLTELFTDWRYSSALVLLILISVILMTIQMLRSKDRISQRGPASVSQQNTNGDCEGAPIANIPMARDAQVPNGTEENPASEPTADGISVAQIPRSRKGESESGTLAESLNRASRLQHSRIIEFSKERVPFEPASRGEKQ
jgi:type II secretory pathway predicted ATPase ExeA